VKEEDKSNLKYQISKISRKGIALFVVAALFLIPISATASTIDDLENQKKSAEQDAAEAQEKADQKAAELKSLNSQINEIEKQVAESENALATTQKDLDATQAIIDQLTTEIAVQEENYKNEKAKLHQVLTAQYMEGDTTSFIYTVIGSNSLSEIMTKEEYYQSINSQINTMMDQIAQTKAELAAKKEEQDKKKQELVEKKQEQESYNSLITSRKKQKEYLSGQASASRESYLAQVEKLQGDIHYLSNAIYAERQRLAEASNEHYVDGSSGYPYSSINSPDPWMFLTRQCTSYSAWKWNVAYGKSWYNTRPGSGSAWNWPALASDQGYSVSGTPRVGAIISWGKTGAMPYGHVAIVESVNANGTIDLSEYNWQPFAYSYRANVSPGYYGSYSYIY
jgi:surface antigen/flagellar biosynthesis chaperone FliJ